MSKSANFGCQCLWSLEEFGHGVARVLSWWSHQEGRVALPCLKSSVTNRDTKVSQEGTKSLLIEVKLKLKQAKLIEEPSCRIVYSYVYNHQDALSPLLRHFCRSWNKSLWLVPTSCALGSQITKTRTCLKHMFQTRICCTNLRWLSVGVHHAFGSAGAGVLPIPWRVSYWEQFGGGSPDLISRPRQFIHVGLNIASQILCLTANIGILDKMSHPTLSHPVPPVDKSE